MLRDGALTLSRQMAAEEAAVQNVVNKILLEEVNAWRQARKAALALDRTLREHAARFGTDCPQA
ncbi:hypothetical protein [Desulfovibrio sp. ZJ200]|uniref:hypothetical protein n=1 Tax=Desulfovibrio sp. ZJ200 TaxID=2709792 RepID=UPI001F15098F|nr:hypothetical protein [Desulfovibrio sp. ZJ200]